ncbi:MAG: hypothetical protein Q9169_001032 [Polycauliona sp. 2 TL-2023]
MPFNLFQTPSTSNKTPEPTSTSALSDTTFPSSEATYAIAAYLLSHAYTKPLRYIKAADTQQFLTEVYGCDPSLHWTWISLAFRSKDIKHAISSSPHKQGIPWRTRRSLKSFIKQQQSDELERKGRYHSSQGQDAGEAYEAGSKDRMAEEVDKMKGIMDARRKQLPLVSRFDFSLAGPPQHWLEREGDSVDENLIPWHRAN